MRNDCAAHRASLPVNFAWKCSVKPDFRIAQFTSRSIVKEFKDEFLRFTRSDIRHRDFARIRSLYLCLFILLHAYIPQRTCKRTNFRWIMYNKISISNIFRYWWEWEFEESFRGIGNGSGKKCLMSIKKITFRFSYIKQQIDRDFTRAHNALITRFRSNSFILTFILFLYKECVKEQILDESCVMLQ